MKIILKDIDYISHLQTLKSLIKLRKAMGIKIARDSIKKKVGE